MPENKREAGRKRWIFTVNELKEAMGLAWKTTQDYCEGLPEADRGPYGPKYDIRDVVREMVDRARTRSGMQQKNFEMMRKARAEADFKELKVREKRAELIPVEAVVKTIESILMDFRARLLPLGSKFAPRVQGLKTIAEKEAELNACRDELLEELRRLDPKRFMAGIFDPARRPGGGSREDGAPAEADSQPMGRSKKVPKSRVKRRAR